MFPLQVGVFNKRIAFWLMVAGLGLSGLISSATAIATNAPCEIQVSYSKGFKIETITNPGACDWTAPATVSQIDFQLVGGGGGGAFSAAAGGGGGGGQYVRVNSAPVVAGDVYELTVGIGGLGGVGGSQADAGASGASSQFLNYTAAGGEGGRIGTGTGAPLGNGGSSGKSASVNAGASVTAASWSGGVASDLLGTTNLSPTCPRTRLGGGGAGTTAVGGTTGIGGAGFGSTFSFSTVNYGGGGGGHRESSATYTTAADGGVGGGGAGGHAASTRPQSGVNGLGGGGGARGGQCGAASLAVAATSGGGSGGTGQVAIRYYAPEVLTAPVAVGLQSKVELQWTKSQEAYAVGYRIVWSTTQSELADAAISARTPISITSKDTTFYSHTALTNGVTYYYRLATAFTNAANQTVVSSYSSLISVSPQMTRTDKFSVTRNTQYFTVPQGVTWLEVTAVGAGANQTNGGWGTGGTVKALIPVVPGETLNLEVGSKPVTIAGEPFWGYNGGGTSSAGIGAAGGGGTDIRRGSAISDRILVAGGGGGIYSSWGGYNNGLVGTTDSSDYSAAGGQTLPVTWPNIASNLTLRSTGSPGIGASSTRGGGGGGGGYIGGSSYGTYGGGGGSSWAASNSVRVEYSATNNAADGSISITYVADPVPANFKVTPLQSQNVITWDSLSVTSLSGVEIYRSTNGTTWTLLTTATGDSYVDTGLTNGTSYQYRIRTKAGTLFSGYTSIITATPQFTVTKTFDPTNQTQDFVVPAGVNWIQARVTGAAGGGVVGGWGNGGSVTSIIPVTPGETLKLNVGTQPKLVSGQSVWGFNGGGTSNRGITSGGGGASDIRRGGNTWSDRIIVAGGGGGAAGSYGGYNAGVNGYRDSGDGSAGAGQSGTIYWPANATTPASRVPGRLGQGANSIASGGGGGGGYFGGSSYTSYGGGAGSSFAYQDAVAVTFQGQQSTTDGSITLTYINNVVPLDVRAIALQNANQITWGPSDFTSLNGYEIYGGTSTNPTTLLATVGANQLYYEHTGLTNGTQYYYRVKAKTSSLKSDYSAEVSAIPAFMAQREFSVTRNTQYFTVPQGVTWLEVTAVGAGANQTNGGWGTGGTVKALIPVVPGETLNLEVGSKPVAIAGEPFWGYNGGGTSSAGIGAAGGGGTDIRRGSAISDRILVAGGGGGIYSSWGGYNNGLVGTTDSSDYSAAGGQTLPVTWPNIASNLTLRSTGSPGIGASSTRGGGGGGGGYIGGSSYGTYGGGGGSSWVTPGAVDVQYSGASNAGDGSIIIRYPTKAYPDAVKVIPLQGQNVVTWKPSEVSGLSTYRIYSGTTPNPTTLLATVASTATSYTHTGLTVGTTYYYRISAMLGSVESERSAVVSGIPNLTVTKTFDPTNQTQDFVVPAGVNWIQARVTGAAGGGVIGGWGNGGSVTSIIPVTPGETLKLNVGTQPKLVSGQSVWGFNGGGTSNRGITSGGGGASDIRRGGNTWSDRIIVAGGGGGAAGSYGGYNAGVNGYRDSGDGSAGAGQSGTIYWPANATTPASRVPGRLGQGANSIASGGGGGGGYFGGSSYTTYGGGAGSSFAYQDAVAVTFQGQQSTTDGSITLTYVMNEPVQNLAAIAGNKQVELSWALHNMTSLSGYRIYGGATSNSATLIATTTATTHKHTALTNGTTYYYRVIPYSGTLEGASSQDVTATPTNVTVVNFGATGGLQTFQVPAQVSWIQVEALGAGANQTNGGWGTGGTVKASLPVTPGEILNIHVGTKPKTVNNLPVWGYNGGGTSSAGIGAAGGGGTDIRRGSAISDRILVAGGGGGIYSSWGGYNNGLVGTTDSSDYSAAGGQTLPVTWPNIASNLTLRSTGSPGIGASSTRGGGGGGGGYIGGSSYGTYGGGGGSSWVTPGAVNIHYTGASNANDGRLIISYTIDNAAPFVTGLSTPAPSGTYRAGTDIFIDVNFNEPVVVDGAPTLDVNAGTRTPVKLSYLSGSGTTALRFKYTVLPGDVTGNGSWLEAVGTNALASAGAIITDPAGNNAVLTLPTPGSNDSLSGTKRLVIDGSKPASPQLVAVSGATRIDLQWTANTEPDLKEYRVYVSTDQENFSQLGTSVAPSTTFSQLVVATGITYFYYITAVDVNGNESDPSQIVSWFIPTPGAISIPSMVIPKITNSTSPTITGVADPNADVLIYQETSSSPQLLGIVRASNIGKYTFNISGPLAEGSYSLSARASASGLVSAWSMVRPLVVDLSSPTVSSILRFSPAVERTSEPILTWLITFTEEVKNLTSTDFEVLTTSAQVTSVQQNPLDKNQWLVSISGGDIGTIRGAVGLAFTASPQTTDLAGNLLVSTTPIGNTEGYIIDRSNPTVTITSSMAALGGSNPRTSVSFSIDYPSSGNFTIEDITVVGGVLTDFIGSGQTFSATLTATAGFQGNGRLSIKSASFTSDSGNANRASIDLVIPIDMVAPTVLSVGRYSANGAYGAGTTVDVVVNFSEHIRVSGSPTLLLETGTTDRNAVFVSATQSQAVFRYTVTQGDNSSDLNYQTISALALAGSSISDAVGNAATLTLPDLNSADSLKATADLVIDTTIPTAPGSPTINISGGKVVANYINGTNTGLSAQVAVTSTDYTLGGRAELLANGVVVASTSNMASPVLVALNSSTSQALQHLIPSGSVEFKLRVFDAAGNYATSSGTTRTADFIAPRVTISSSIPAPLGSGQLTTAFWWSETVTGFDCALNIAYTNLSGTGCSQSGSTYSRTVTAAANVEGIAKVEMVASNISAGIFDTAGNPAPSATPLILLLDSKAPSVVKVEKISPDGEYGLGSTIDFKVVFNEPIALSGFSSSSPFVALNSSSSAKAFVTGTSSDSIVLRYTVQSGDSTLDLNYGSTSALNLGAFAIRDLANNSASLTLPATNANASLAGTAALVVDGVAPDAPVISALAASGGNRVAGYANSTNVNVVASISITVSQAVGGRVELRLGSQVISSKLISALSPSPLTLDFGTQTNPQLRQVLAEGAATFSVVIFDAVGNSSRSSSNSLIVDYAAPVLSGASSPARTLGFQEVATLVVSSSDSVLYSAQSCSNTAFTRVGGTVSCAIWPQSAETGSSTIQLSFSPQVQGGWSVTLPLGLLQDRAGNPTSAISLNGMADTVEPRVVSVRALSANGTYRAGDRVSVNVMFDEVVRVDGQASLSLVVAANTNRQVSLTSGNGTATLRFDYFVQSGDFSLDLATSAVNALSGAITDLANNPANLSLSVASSLVSNSNIVIDGARPQAPVAPPAITAYASTISQGASINSRTTNVKAAVSISSQANLSRAELLLGNVVIAQVDSVSNVTNVVFDLGAASNDTVRELFTASAVLSVRLVSIGGNVSELSPTASPTVDYVSPSVTITAASSTLSHSVSSTTVTFTLGENSNTFAAGDVSVAGGSLSNFNGSGSVYTATFTPLSDGDWSIRTLAGVFEDVAGNPAEASNLLTGTADTSRPTITGIRHLAASASYRISQSFLVEVAFSEKVTLSGTLSLPLTAGDQCAAANATYISGSGSTRLTFIRTAASGDNCADVVESGSHLLLSGALTDLIGNAAELSFTPALVNGVSVNADVPTAPAAPRIDTDVSVSATVVDSSASRMSFYIDFLGARSYQGIVKLYFGTSLFATQSYAVNSTSVSFALNANSQLELQEILEPMIANSASVEIRAVISDDFGNFGVSPSTTLTAYWLTTYAEKLAAQQLISTFTSSPEPTTFSYLAAGVDGVNLGNLELLNDLLAQLPTSDRNDYPAELNRIVSVVNEIQAIANDTNGSYNPLTLSDLDIICASGTSPLCSISDQRVLDLLSDVIANLEFADTDSLAELNVLANFANKMISGIMPTLAEFQAAGFQSLGPDDISLVWSELVANPASVAGRDSVSEIDSIVSAALSKKSILGLIANYTASSTVSPTISDFSTIGVQGVTSSNIALVNQLLETVSPQDSDTVAEIDLVVEIAQKIRDLADGSKDGESALMAQDLAIIGLNGSVSSSAEIALFNAVLDGLSPSGADTTGELRALASIVQEISRLAGISGPGNLSPASSLTVEQLALIGISVSPPATLADAITGFVNGNNDLSDLTSIAALEQAIADATAARLEQGALSELLALNEASTKSFTVQDFADAGLSSVTGNNLSTILSLIKSDSTVLATGQDLQDLIDAANKLLAGTDGIDNANVNLTASEFAALGVNPAGGAGIDSSAEVLTMNNILDEMTKANVDTFAELSALASVVEKLIATADATAGGNAPTGSQALSVSSFELIGISGVNGQNLSAVLAAIVGDPGSSDLANSKVTDPARLQALVDEAIQRFTFDQAATNIAAYDGLNTAPTRLDYLNAGVTGVNSDNLSLINQFVAPLSPSQTDTGVELQDLVTAIEKLKTAANATVDNSASLSGQDFSSLGVTGITRSGQLALVNHALDQAALSAVDSISELQQLSDLVNSLFSSAANATTASPALSISSFERLGVSGVTGVNLSVLADLIRTSGSDGTGIDTAAELQGLVTQANALITQREALAKIRDYAVSSSALSAADYLAAKVTTLSPTLVPLLNGIFAQLSVTQSDTLQEIQAVNDVVNKIKALSDGQAGNGAGLSAMDLAAIGFPQLDSATELALLNEILDRFQLSQVDDYSELRDLILRTLSLISGAAGSTTISAADFVALGFTAVSTGNLELLKERILASPDSGSGVDSLAEINALIVLAMADAKKAESIKVITDYNGSNQAPLLADYFDGQVTSVTSANLSTLNSFFADLTITQSNTVEKVQAVVDAILDLQAAADSTTNASGQVSNLDLVALGVGSQSTEVLSLINESLDGKSFGAVDTVAEVAALVGAVSKLVTIQANYPAQSPNLAQFELIGITGITSSNLAFVVGQLSNYSPGQLDTLVEAQALVNAAIAEYERIAALTLIASYTGANSAPTRTDFATAGAVNVTDGNLAMVNSFIAQLSVDESNSLAEIQATVNAVNKIRSGIAQSLQSPASLTEGDFTALDVSGANNLNFRTLFNDIASNKTTSDLDTFAEFNAIAKLVDGLMSIAATGTSSVAITAGDFSLIGVTGVTSGNLADVISKLSQSSDDGSGINLVVKVQQLVTSAANQAAADAAQAIIQAFDGTNTIPTAADYAATGVYGVDASNLDQVNRIVADALEIETNSFAKVQAIVDAISKLALLVDGTAGTGMALTLADLTELGASAGGLGVAELALLNSLLDRMFLTQVDSPAELQAAIDSAVKIMVIASGGSSTSALTAQDFTALGFPQVTAENVIMIAVRIAESADNGSGVDTYTELKAMIDIVLTEIAAASSLPLIVTFAEGAGSSPLPVDYSLANVQVDDSVVYMINVLLAIEGGKRVDTRTELQNFVDGIANALTTITNYADGQGSAPTLANYQTLGITGLSAANLASMNSLVAGAGALSVDTLAEIQSLVAQIPTPSSPQPGASSGVEPVGSTDTNPVTSSSQVVISEVVIVETPTGLVVGIKAGRDARSVLIRATDSNGKIFSFTTSASALEATVLDLAKGRQYKIEVIPYSSNGIQGESYLTLVNTKPNNPVALDVTRQSNGQVAVDWVAPNGFVSGYRVEVSRAGKVVFEKVVSKTAIELPANLTAGKIVVHSLGEGGAENASSAFSFTAKTTIGAPTVRFATRDSKTLISFPARAVPGTSFKVYVNGKQACQTKILSCTVKTELRPNDAIRVVSSDGASSPSTHFFDPFAFTGELSFVPNSAKPAANFDRQFKSLVASLKAGGYKKVVVTGHANLLGNKPTANSTKLATARGEFVAKKLRLALPGVEILVVNRSVFSPLFSGSNLRNIRAEVYAVN